jgi:hypothetical protein
MSSPNEVGAEKDVVGSKEDSMLNLSKVITS